MNLLRHRVWFSSRAASTSDRPPISRILSLAAFLVLIATRASAAIHPVPLDPKADASTCLECHDDKTKGKSVHSAMAHGLPELP